MNRRSVQKLFQIIITFNFVIWSSFGSLSTPWTTLSAQAAAEYVTLSAFSGTPGASIMISGGGYTPSSEVKVFIDDTMFPSDSMWDKTVLADKDGSITDVTINIPITAKQGPLVITAMDLTSANKVSNSYYVQSFNPSLSATSENNTPGSIVTVSGNGFYAGEEIALSLESSVSTVQADADGTFTSSELIIPIIKEGTQLIKAKGLKSGAEGVAYLYVGGFYPSSYPSDYYLLPESTLTFSGGGYAPTEAVEVKEKNSLSVLTTLDTDEKGMFTKAGSVVMPLSFAGASKTFVLSGLKSKASSEVTITVGQFNPTIAPSAYYVLPGNDLTFSGSGFGKQEDVSVYDGMMSSTVLGTATTDEEGNFKAGAAIDTTLLSGGDHTMVLVGQKSNGKAQVGVTIGSYSPQVSPSSYFILPGQSLSFGGSGFAKDELISAFKGIELNPFTAFLADKLGAFMESGLHTISFKPFGIMNSVDYRFLGEKSKKEQTASVTLGKLNPQLSISEYYIKPGQTELISGTGFAPNEPVTITLKGTEQNIIATADKDGAFEQTEMVIPFGIEKSPVVLQATGSESNAVVSVDLTLGNYIPSVDASTYYTMPGSVITVTGHGFAPKEEVSVTLGDTNVIGVADKAGDTEAIELTLPYKTKENRVDITLTGVETKATSTVSIGLSTFSPQISPSTSYATPGSLVTFSGQGFIPGENVSIMSNLVHIGEVKADKEGLITTEEIALPFGKSSVEYVFTGSLSDTSVTTPITLASFNAGLGLDNYYGVGGSSIVITGSGFASGETISLMFGETKLKDQKADTKGVFSLTTTVPFASAGEKQVVATGALSSATAKTGFTQAQVFTSAELETYAGAPGSAVTIIGKGFMPGETIQIMTDRTESVIVATSTADAQGGFKDSTFVLPTDFKEGDLVFTIQGTQSLNPQTITYYVTGS